MKEHVTPTIQLGGRMWELRIGHKALQKFSALTRVDIDHLGAIIGRYDMMILLLWCILTVQDPSVTHETLDDWLDTLPVLEWRDLLGRISEGIAASFPDEDEEAAAQGGDSAPDPTGAAT